MVRAILYFVLCCSLLHDIIIKASYLLRRKKLTLCLTKVSTTPVKKVRCKICRQLTELLCRVPPQYQIHTLWNDLSRKKKCSSVDISNAFFSVPVHPDSQFWFAFTYRMKRYSYTSLPQGYCESPTIFSQAMSANLVKFNPPNIVICGWHSFGFTDRAGL